MRAAWSQIKADALGVPLVNINRPEGAPLGVALLAGYGVGLFQDLDEAASAWIKPGQRVVPRRDVRTHYEARLARYKQLIAALDQWSSTVTEHES